MVSDYLSDKSKLGESGKIIFRNKNSTLINSDISAKIKSIDPYGEIVV
jgi:type II secretory pathway component HofQ